MESGTAENLRICLDPYRSRGRVRNATVRGWNIRHAGAPTVGEQLEFAAQSEEFQLLYRGDSNPPDGEVFTFGIKSRPAIYQGDLERLRYEAGEVSRDATKFRAISEAFLEGPSVRDSPEDRRPNLSALLAAYEASDCPRRRRLAEVLLVALQHQNARQAVRRWRNLLFLVSCSRSETTALRYALGHRFSDPPPELAWVYEYAPPVNDTLHESAQAVLNEFQDLLLTSAFPDLDEEVFVKMAMLPHYILGVSELRRAGDNLAYQVSYQPNPHYESGLATLLRPPQLTDAQQIEIEGTRGQVAWLWWDEARGIWSVDENQ